MVIASAHGPRCVAAEAVATEIARHIPRLASKRDLDPALLFAGAPGHADRLAGRERVRGSPRGGREAHRRPRPRRLADRRARAQAGPPVWTQDTRTTPTPTSRSSRPATCSTRCATPDTTQILHDWRENWREQPFRAPLLWASATTQHDQHHPRKPSLRATLCASPRSRARSRAAGSRRCPRRCRRSSRRGASARRGTRACSRCRRGSGSRARSPIRRPRPT